LKEEKTVLLDSSSESRRIAMISSGIPGTLEESTGLKAYILVDDFLIGRDQTKVDFKISSLSVGRIHARITRRENSFFIEDLNSRNGTFLDQKRLKKKEEYLLPENCKLRFAENEFYFVAN
jgi:pSer/pThr/pTyr-binding forkhead associated (FHA) protein